MKTLTLISRTWRNRSTLAELHSVEIVADGFCIARLKEFASAWSVESAIAWLQISNMLPEKTGSESIHAWLDSLNITFHHSQSTVANKSDL